MTELKIIIFVDVVFCNRIELVVDFDYEHGIWDEWTCFNHIPPENNYFPRAGVVCVKRNDARKNDFLDNEEMHV